MFDLGLTSGELATYLAGLATNHRVRFIVELYDADDTFLADLTANANIWVSGGEVPVDATADVSRSLKLDLIDPTGATLPDPSSPAVTALNADRQIRVIRSDNIPTLGWVDCPVFHGPITKVEGDVDQVTVEALGKEFFFLPPHMHWRTRTIHEGTLVSDAVESLLLDRGETITATVTTDEFVKYPFGVLGTEDTWSVIRRLLTPLDMNYFFDGEGVFTLRDYSTTPVAEFEYGVNMLSVPNKPWDYTTVRNTVQIRGARPNQGRRVIATVYANPVHHLSPEVLARNGVNRYMVHLEENDQQRQRTVMQTRAFRILASSTAEVYDVEFDALPIPSLQENDVIQITDQTATTYNLILKKFVIPLSVQNPMKIGSTRGAKFPRHRRRKHGTNRGHVHHSGKKVRR